MTTTTAAAALNTPKDYAYFYRDKLGFCVFVLRIEPASKRKEPAVLSWNPYKKRKPTDQEIEQWFTINPNYNLAIPMGTVSQAIGFDIDGPTAAKRVEEQRMKMSTNLRIAFDNTMVNKTGGGGIHIIFKIEEDISDISQITLWHDGNEHSEIKLQGNGHYVVAAPSVHPCGIKYQWNGNKPQLITRRELEELIRLLSDKGTLQSIERNNNNASSTIVIRRRRSPLSPQKIQKLLAALKPRYRIGRRHTITLGYSGFMRKCGYSLETVEEFCVIVCQTFNDEERQSRLRDVRDTFGKPIESGREIAGWTLLNDIS